MDRKDNGEKSFIIILFLFQLVKLTTNFPSQHLTQTYYKLITNTKLTTMYRNFFCGKQTQSDDDVNNNIKTNHMMTTTTN